LFSFVEKTFAMKTSMLLTGFILLCFTHIPGSLSPQVIHVPGDQPTIQEGINAAQEGDTVLVAPGAYLENINFVGKDIVVASHYILDKDLSFISSTIIDGSLAAGADTASCVLFVSGEGPEAVLQGFSLRGGTGTDWIDPQFPMYIWHSGGGVFMFQSSPTIMNNHILGNHCDDDGIASGASGGGICTYGGNPLICNNIIKYNTAQYGAGVVIDYSGCVFKNNILAHNSGGQEYGGGGFWTIGNGAEDIVIENNTIINNLSEKRGGAMYLWSSQVTAINNILWGNTQQTGDPIYLHDGASISLTYSDIEGGYAGEGIIDLYPDFADTNYLLSPLSPCIDAGNPDPLFNDPEDPAYPGQAQWPSQGLPGNDMGAYGGPMSELLAGMPTGIAMARLYEHGLIEMSLYPNPCSGSVSLRYLIHDSGYLISDLFTSDGSKIRELLRQQVCPGDFEMEIDMSFLPAGVYLLRLQVAEEIAVRKLLVK
jgi:hypothetical protein